MRKAALTAWLVVFIGGPWLGLDCVAGGRSDGWSYHYGDDFSTDRASNESCMHSVFWPREAFPPPETYLFYNQTGVDRGLAFRGYCGQPAHLGYCFPTGPAPAPYAVRGMLEVDVSFVSDPYGGSSSQSYCYYLVSADGVNWSPPQALGAGRHNIALESPAGECYVVLLGTNVIIDNLDVQLYALPASIHVPGDFDNIQQAIDAAGHGDIIEVGPGVYEGDGNRDIAFRGKAITVRSTAGPEATIIDCMDPNDFPNEQHRGFYFHEGEGPRSVLRGFTIRHGRISGSGIPPDHMRWDEGPSHPIGGGIYCEFSSPSIVNCVVKNCGAELGGGIGCVGSAPMIIGCVVEECTAGGFGTQQFGGWGGGIGLVRGCDARITDCIIRNNSGFDNSRGGGLYCRHSSAVISRCDISFNSAPGHVSGGGIYCTGTGSRVILQNSIISHNVAFVGGGIFTEGSAGMPGGSGHGDGPRCHVQVVNCTVASNRLSEPQPAFPGGGICSVGSDVKVKNSIVWYNDGTQVFIHDAPGAHPVVFSDIEGGYPGMGNIDEDPLFAPVAMPDYHLQSLYGRFDPRSGTWVTDTVHSPCIDTGDPRYPVGYELMPNGERVNMGAYGGTREASKSVGRMVYHVDGIKGNDANDGLSRATAFATIQRGINSTRDGDVVMVWPGVYEEQVNFVGKGITVQSAADAAVVVAPTGYAFSFFTAEGPDSVLRNFVIRKSEFGIYCSGGSSPVISNLTIADNEFGINAVGGAHPYISNCILWNNTFGGLSQCKARYSCVQHRDPNEGEGNIRKNPLFADANNGDYHLRSRRGRYWPAYDLWVLDKLNSPCIDAGDPGVCPRGEGTPNGGRLNMGAHGGTSYGSMSEWPLRGDVNKDGIVNLRDMAFVAESWLKYLPWAPNEWGNVDITNPVNGLVFTIPASAGAGQGRE